MPLSYLPLTIAPSLDKFLIICILELNLCRCWKSSMWCIFFNSYFKWTKLSNQTFIEKYSKYENKLSEKRMFNIFFALINIFSFISIKNVWLSSFVQKILTISAVWYKYQIQSYLKYEKKEMNVKLMLDLRYYFIIRYHY